MYVCVPLFGRVVLSKQQQPGGSEPCMIDKFSFAGNEYTFDSPQAADSPISVSSVHTSASMDLSPLSSSCSSSSGGISDSGEYFGYHLGSYGCLYSDVVYIVMLSTCR